MVPNSQLAGLKSTMKYLQYLYGADPLPNEYIVVQARASRKMVTNGYPGFFAGGGEVIVKVVLACVSTATHMSACEQPRVIWGHVPK